MELCGEKLSNGISSESTQQIHSPKSMHALESVSTKVVQRIAKFQILEFCHFFSFSLTWDYMGMKLSNDISSEVCIRFALQNSCALLGVGWGGGFFTIVVKRNLKF